MAKSVENENAFRMNQTRPDKPALKRSEVKMFNSIKSATVKTRQPLVRPMRHRSLMIFLCFVAMTVGFSGRAYTGSTEGEARVFFTKFVAAQNAHNIDDVRAMLSPDMLWYSRGVETRGRNAVADRFSGYYKGTWHLNPDMSQFCVVSISSDVSQILVPIVFTRGLPGAAPQDNTFLISQTFVRDASGWHVASILPVANTQLK